MYDEKEADYYALQESHDEWFGNNEHEHADPEVNECSEEIDELQWKYEEKEANYNELAESYDECLIDRAECYVSESVLQEENNFLDSRFESSLEI